MKEKDYMLETVYLSEVIHMKQHAEVCPVCKGTGKYKDYTNCNYSATIYVEKTCHGCAGKGWVTVIDDYTPEIPSGSITYNTVCSEDIQKNVPSVY